MVVKGPANLEYGGERTSVNVAVWSRCKNSMASGGTSASRPLWIASMKTSMVH